LDSILEQLKDIGVGIFINNVEMVNSGYLHEISQVQLINEIDFSWVFIALLSNLLIQRMLKRGTRSAIINLSSVGGQNACPYISNYSATNAYNDLFWKAVDVEYDGKIDVLSVKPIYV